MLKFDVISKINFRLQYSYMQQKNSTMLFVTLLVSSFLSTVKIYAQGNAKSSFEIEVQEGENWWGGAVNDGSQMPYTNGFSYDMYADNKGNQAQPLLLSNDGNVIWSEEPYKFTIEEGEISIQPRGEVKNVKAGNTLREAYAYASKNYFPANGELPEELLFTAPQYNTWIELMYDQNQKDILSYAHAIIANGLPPGVLMIDDNWQQDYGNWDFRPDRFPDPKAMIEELHEMGFKVMLWVCPFVSPDSETYRKLTEKNMFLKNPDDMTVSTMPWVKGGQPAMIYWWNGVSAVLDLSNPEAGTWFKGELNKLVDKYKVDGFKLDAGDSYFYPEDLVSFKKGTSPNEQSALFGKIGLDFPLNEYRAMWKMAGLPLVQRLADKNHSWEDLNTLIPNIIAQGLMGYAFTCPDMIGGGEFMSFLDTETIDQDLIVRSAQVHALMPMMQFSVSPWRILDEEHMSAIKKAVQLRGEFVPTILDLAKQAAKTGEPIIRNMEYVFPNQGFEMIRDQFMLGNTILVAPILTEKGKRSVILPKGKWKYIDGKTIKGNRKIELDVKLDELPYFVKI